MPRLAPGVTLGRSPLAQVGRAFMPHGTFIADDLLPPSMQALRDGVRMVWAEDSSRRIADVSRGADGKLNALDKTHLTEKAYKCRFEGIKEPIDVLEARNLEQAFMIDVLGQASANVQDTIRVTREKQVIDICTDPLKVGAAVDSTTLTGVGLGINNDKTADVEALIVHMHQTMATQLGRRPNRIAMSLTTALKLGANSQVRERVVYTTNQEAQIVRESAGKVIVNTVALASLFQVEQVLVSDVQYVTSAKGAVATANAYAWPDDMMLAFVSESGTLEQPQMGRTFAWAPESGPNGEPIILPTWQEEGGLIDNVGGYTHRDPQVFNTNAAILYSNLNA